MPARFLPAVAALLLSLAPVRAEEPKKDLPPPAFTAPKGWATLEPRESDKQFAVAGRFRAGEGEKTADVVVMALRGDGGGLAANVNRWRNQVQLKPLDNADALKSLAPIKVDGRDAHLLDITGTNSKDKPERIVAAVASHGGQTVFVKLSGSPAAVGDQKEAFDEFVKSLRFPK